jgi:hypothetical protein
LILVYFAYTYEFCLSNVLDELCPTLPFFGKRKVGSRTHIENRVGVFWFRRKIAKPTWRKTQEEVA